MPTSPILQLDRVSRRFGSVSAVDSVSFDVGAGQFVTLLGPSGCGKTTTLRLIAGFETPDGGTIRLKDRIVAADGQLTPPKDRRVGMVFQDYALFPHLNVADNVAFGLRDDQSARTARVQELLAQVGLDGYGPRMTYELSGGQQQRVALARALAPRPDVLLLDEPFSNLDTALRGQMRTEMRAILRAANTTCIFVTHAQDEALSLSDRVVVMIAGRVAQSAPPQTLYERPISAAVAAFVGEANLIDGLADGAFAECALGRVPLLDPARGPVTLMIRPEKLRVAEAGIPVRVVWREYYGHDQRIGAVLADGTPLVARLPSGESAAPGDDVRLSVRGPVVAYPRA